MPNTNKSSDRNKEVVFSNIGNRRAQSAGRFRSNPKEVLMDQIKHHDDNADG